MSALGLIGGTGLFFAAVWFMLRAGARRCPELHICEFDSRGTFYADATGRTYTKCIHGCELRCYNYEMNVFGQEKHVR